MSNEGYKPQGTDIGEYDLDAYTVEELEANSKAYSPYVEVANTGLNRFGNDVFEEFLPQLAGAKGRKVFTEMSANDPIIGAILFMCQQMIRKCEWSVQPASDAEADVAAAKFVKECMEGMNTPWKDVICEILSMFIYGWSFLEVVYKIDEQGRITWKKMPIRAQNSLDGWIFSDSGAIKGIRLVSPPNYRAVTIPMSKGLLFRTEVTRDNPEGRSLLRNAYRPWYFKKKIEEIEGIGIERDLAGLPVVIPPSNVDIYNETDPFAMKMRNYGESIIRNVRRDKTDGILLPNGWELKLMTTGGSRQFDTNAIISRYDHRIAIAALADMILLGTNSGGGYSLAEVKSGMLASALEAISFSIADVFNKYAVEPLFQYNYFPNRTGLPKIKPSQIEIPALDILGSYFRNVGLDIADDMSLYNFMREIASLPPVDEKQFDEIKAKREKAREKTAAATAGREAAGETAHLAGESASPKERTLKEQKLKNNQKTVSTAGNSRRVGTK